MQAIPNTLRLTGKELCAIRRDHIMVALILYVFSVAQVMVSMSTEVHELPVAVIDEDHSQLSARLTDAIRPPLFAPPVPMTPVEAAAAQAASDAVLVLEIPPGFEKTVRAGGHASLMVMVDATAMARAGNGTAFLTGLLSDEIAAYLAPGETSSGPVDVVLRSRFNPNTISLRFTSVVQLANAVTILTLILAGASMLREREHGTLEHVLVMPVRPIEVVLSKVLATTLAIVIVMLLNLLLVVEGYMHIPVAGALWLYALGATAYVLAVSSFGLLLSSFTRSIGQFGLLIIPVIVVTILLSGGMTPMESMPGWLQVTMRAISPAPHFVAFSQSVLYRGSGIGLAADNLGAMAAMAAAALVVVTLRFKRVLTN